MPIFDRLQHGADLAKFKANQVLRINRVQGEIGGIRREIQVVREKIVNTALGLHQRGLLTLPELEELCLTIDKYKVEIEEKEALIESIRAETLGGPVMAAPQSQPANPCPKCNYDVPLGATFCPNCGQMLANTATEATAPSLESGKCFNCGSVMPSDSEFCPNCGNRVTTSEQGG